MLEEKLWMIFFIVALIIVLLAVILAVVLTHEGTKKWKALIDPTKAEIKMTDYKEEKIELRRNNKGNKNKDEEKKKKVSLMAKIKSSKKYIAWSEKFHYWYYQAGCYDKTFDDFIASQVKYTIFGILYFLMMYFLLQNIWIALIPSLVLVFFAPLKIYSDIGKRRSKFKGDFPFYLKTLSFVMSNGANPINALVDVTNKMPDSVLKEVMEDVLEEKVLNGGNFESAFDVLLLKMNIEEVKDFIDTLKNAASKGVSISEAFNNQSELMQSMIASIRNKKIANAENKILLPILLVIGSVALLIVSF